MIYLDSFYDDCVPTPSFKEAADMIARRGRGDLLAGMQEMQDIMDEAEKASSEDYDAVEATMSAWRYEIKAYNVVFENMSKLFEEKV